MKEIKGEIRLFADLNLETDGHVARHTLRRKHRVALLERKLFGHVLLNLFRHLWPQTRLRDKQGKRI